MAAFAPLLLVASFLSASLPLAGAATSENLRARAGALWVQNKEGAAADANQARPGAWQMFVDAPSFSEPSMKQVPKVTVPTAKAQHFGFHASSTNPKKRASLTAIRAQLRKNVLRRRQEAEQQQQVKTQLIVENSSSGKDEHGKLWGFVVAGTFSSGLIVAVLMKLGIFIY